MLIYLARHGETEMNRLHICQGQVDSDLNQTGVKQAETLAKKIESVKFDKIYTSHLQRAYKTTQILAKNQPIVRDERLNEINLGVFQNQPRSELNNYFAGQLKLGLKEEDISYPEGESGKHFLQRVNNFFESLEGRKILVICHGVVISRFLAKVQNYSLEKEGKIGNCGCFLIEKIDGRYYFKERIN